MLELNPVCYHYTGGYRRDVLVHVASALPVSSAFRNDYDDLANDTLAYQLDRFSNDSRISELGAKMEAVTLSPWEIVKLLWNSVDTPVAVGAAFFVGRYN